MTFATPLIAVLLPAVALLGGCHGHSSLVYAGMPDSQIERRIRAELDGVTDLDERFHAVAGMTDWENVSTGGSTFAWHGMSLVPWDPDRREMLIPLANERTAALLDFPWLAGMAAIRFDEAGRVEAVERRETERTEWPLSLSDDWDVKLIEDPWLQASPQHGTCGPGVLLWYGLPRTVHISAKDWRRSRWVDFHVWVAGVEAEDLPPAPRVTVSGSTDMVLLRTQGPDVYRPKAAGAFIIPSYWEQPYAGDIPEQYRTKFFPSVTAIYRVLLILEPHDGVDLTIEVLGQEATP